MAEDIGRRLKYAENGYKDETVTCMLGWKQYETALRRNGAGDNVLDVNF